MLLTYQTPYLAISPRVESLKSIIKTTTNPIKESLKTRWVCLVSKTDDDSATTNTSAARAVAKWWRTRMRMEFGSYPPSKSEDESPGNAHLRRLVENNELSSAVDHVEMLHHGKGAVLDVDLCSRLIRELCKLRDVRKAERVLEILEDSGAVLDVVLYTVMIKWYCKLKEVDKALELLDRMTVAPDVMTFSPILETLCGADRWKDVEKVMDDMTRKGCPPDVVTFNILINGFCKTKKLTKALELLDLMPVAPDVATYTSLLQALRYSRQLDTEMEFLERLAEIEGHPSLLVKYNYVLEMIYRKKGVGKVVEFLDKMRTKGCNPGVETYTALIKLTWKKGRLDDAVVLMKKMPSGCQLNAQIYNPILQYLCSTSRGMDAENLLGDMIRRGCSPNVETFTILIDFFCAEGLLERAICHGGKCRGGAHAMRFLKKSLDFTHLPR